MSVLTFGGATTDRVDCGSSAAIDDVAAYTICVWVFITTHTNSRHLAGKGGFTTLVLDTTHGASNIRIYRERATTNTLYRTNDSRATTNVWHFIAGTFDDAATPEAHIYEATPDGVLTECAYGTTTDGAGAVVTDAARSWHWGNSGAAAPASALQGDMAVGQFYSRVLTIPELTRIKNTGARLTGCLIDTLVGSNGTSTTRDETGNANTGTVTGATLNTARGYPWLGLHGPWGLSAGAVGVTPSAASTGGRVFQDRRSRFVGAVLGRGGRV